jgi:hypothetical protein
MEESPQQVPAQQQSIDAQESNFGDLDESIRNTLQALRQLLNKQEKVDQQIAVAGAGDKSSPEMTRAEGAQEGEADRCPSSLALGCTYGSLIEVREYSPRASRDVIYSITSGPFGIWSSALSGTTFASLASYNSPGTAMRPSCSSRVRCH